MHHKADQAAWDEMHKHRLGVSKWVLQWIHNQVWYEWLELLTVDHSAHNSACFEDEEKAAFMDSKVSEMVQVRAVVLLPIGCICDVLTRLSLAPKPCKGDKW